MLLEGLNKSIHEKCLEWCLKEHIWCQLLSLLFIKCEFEVLKYLNDVKFQVIKRGELISLEIYMDISDFNN